MKVNILSQEQIKRKKLIQGQLEMADIMNLEAVVHAINSGRWSVLSTEELTYTNNAGVLANLDNILSKTSDVKLAVKILRETS